MQIQTIGALHLMIYVGRRELRRRGLDPDELGLRDVIRLTGDACREEGIPPSRTEEIEAYPERGGVLVFVQLSPAEKEWFRFASLCDAIDALMSGSEPDGRLVHLEGYYYISAHGEELRKHYSEFGDSSWREWSRIEENADLVLHHTGLKGLWHRLKKDRKIM